MSNLKTKAKIESGGDKAQMYDKDGLPIYGMDLEIQKKLQSKRDPYREAEAQEWIETVTGEKFSDPDIQVALKDGILLCKLANVLKPGCIKKISKAKMAFMQMNNINAFIRACSKYFGLRKTDVFVTLDLYEGKNVPSVVDTIFSLGAACMDLKGYNGPVIGAKRSKKTEYNFTEEQLAESRNAPTKFSEGGKGCASQAGTRSISNEVVKSKDSGTKGSVSRLNEGGKGCASQAGTRSISNEVVKSKNTGTLGSVSKLNEGGKGCSSQAGTRSISHEVVRVQSGKKEQQEVTTTNNDEVEEEVDEPTEESEDEQQQQEPQTKEEPKEEEQQQQQVEKDEEEEVVEKVEEEQQQPKEEQQGEEEEEVDVEVDVDVDEDVEDDEDDDDEDSEEDTSLEELEKLAAQRDAGEITDEEFAKRKKEILGL